MALAALSLGVAAPASWAQVPVEFEDAEVYFELNNTDGDLGIHSLVDGGPWRKLEINSPDGRNMLDIRVRSILLRQELTELFFESAEPTFDELTPTKFFNRFPEGEYEILGEDADGGLFEGLAEVTHVMPAPPDGLNISGTPAAEDCDVDPLPVVAKPIVIGWDEVTMSHPDLGTTNVPIEVDGYQVVVERELEPELNISVDLNPDAPTKLRIPNGLIESGDELKFEVLVREASGNQTAAESCFVVE
jgi:hypothetical protein